MWAMLAVAMSLSKARLMGSLHQDKRSVFDRVFDLLCGNVSYVVERCVRPCIYKMSDAIVDAIPDQ